MNLERFLSITRKYPRLRLAVVGDFCLDRYLEIDPARRETSIETGRPVHNVVRVRSQPGAAGTILNNLEALGVGRIFPVGFCGEDGEGFELRRALQARAGVRLDYFFQTPLRRTFTYCKPLLVARGRPPVELNRLDSKNWTPTPRPLREKMNTAVRSLAGRVDAVILMDQVDIAGTGVVTAPLLAAINSLRRARPGLLILADSRRGLKGFPPVDLKMNGAELRVLAGAKRKLSLAEIRSHAAHLARRCGRKVFVTLAEQGIVGAAPDGTVEHAPAHPVRGPIDIVGAGDAVAANLTAALAAGATLSEALALANAAASIVIHQLGTTGTASVPQLRKTLPAALRRPRG